MSLGTLAAAALASAPYYRPSTPPTFTPIRPVPPRLPTSPPPTKPKQRRYRASPDQLATLITRFEQNPSPTSAELHELAARIAMPAQSVVLWFKNRRARVPHKKTEKSRKRSPSSQQPRPTPLPDDLPFSEAAAAASMAEMAMTLAIAPPPTQPVPSPPSTTTTTLPAARIAGRNITNQPSTPLPLPPKTPRSNAPLTENAPPNQDSLHILAKLLCARVDQTDKLSAPLMRRPRIVPPTPRLCAQRTYVPGDSVEVLETGRGICRAWYSAVVVEGDGPERLCLGESAAEARAGSSAGGCRVEEGEEERGGLSPRTVRSPAAGKESGGREGVFVEYVHRRDGRGGLVREQVWVGRIRPGAPVGGEMWRPESGEAVEVLKDGAWFVGVLQTFVVRKGYLVSFENGDAEWVRWGRIRPYQIWRGGDTWVVKVKPPLPVVRKSVGRSVTHPVGGKRKREGRRRVAGIVDRSGPDGLPEGWRVEYGEDGSYVAPDGRRLRGLKEAQRYVRMMGPV